MADLIRDPCSYLYNNPHKYPCALLYDNYLTVRSSLMDMLCGSTPAIHHTIPTSSPYPYGLQIPR